MKKCSKCGKILSHTEFYESKARNSLLSICKECNSIQCFTRRIERIIKAPGGFDRAMLIINDNLAKNEIIRQILSKVK